MKSNSVGVNNNPAPASRAELRDPRIGHGLQPPPPEREIPAVVTLLKERLENLHKTAAHLRERLGPMLTEPSPSAGEGSMIRMTPLGADIEAAISLANDIQQVLSDIHNRLEL
jgi:hypothetical protein